MNKNVRQTDVAFETRTPKNMEFIKNKKIKNASSRENKKRANISPKTKIF